MIICNIIVIPNKKPRFQKEFIWRGQGYDCKWDFISNTKYNFILPIFKRNKRRNIRFRIERISKNKMSSSMIWDLKRMRRKSCQQKKYLGFETTLLCQLQMESRTGVESGNGKIWSIWKEKEKMPWEGEFTLRSDPATVANRNPKSTRHTQKKEMNL